MKNFSSAHSLGIHSHKNLEFADIRIGTDNRLFIDPSRVRLAALAGDPWAQQAVVLLDTFFDALFNAARNRDLPALRRLIARACGEINETHLGWSHAQPAGNGASFSLIFPALRQMVEQGLFDQGCVIGIEDVPIWTKGIDADRLSDWVTNIIWPVLEQFTVSQYQQYGLPQEHAGEVIRRAWDPYCMTWVNQPTFPLLCAGQRILLCPKRFLCTKLLFGTADFLRTEVLEYRQRCHLDARTALCGQHVHDDGSVTYTAPTKKDLLRYEVRGQGYLPYLLTHTQGHPEFIRHYHQRHEYQPGNEKWFISDETLDTLLYA